MYRGSVNGGKADTAQQPSPSRVCVCVCDFEMTLSSRTNSLEPAMNASVWTRCTGANFASQLSVFQLQGPGAPGGGCSVRSTTGAAPALLLPLELGSVGRAAAAVGLVGPAGEGGCVREAGVCAVVKATMADSADTACCASGPCEAAGSMCVCVCARMRERFCTCLQHNALLALCMCAHACVCTQLPVLVLYHVCACHQGHQQVGMCVCVCVCPAACALPVCAPPEAPAGWCWPPLPPARCPC